MDSDSDDAGRMDLDAPDSDPDWDPFERKKSGKKGRRGRAAAQSSADEDEEDEVEDSESGYSTGGGESTGACPNHALFSPRPPLPVLSLYCKSCHGARHVACSPSFFSLNSSSSVLK